VQEKSQDYKLIDQCCADDSLSLPAPRRGGDALGEDADCAQAFCLSDEEEVLHDGEIREAAETVELLPGDEDGLIAVRQLQEA